MEGTTFTGEDKEEGKRCFQFLIEKGLDNDAIVKRFDCIAEKYDKMQAIIGNNLPEWMAESLAALYTHNRKTVSILDVAAGTGLVSCEMRKQGFLHIDGLEPSEKMLEQAKKNNLYERYICVILADKTLDIADDTYDIVTVVGLSSEIFSTLPIKSFEELVRITKSGGHILMNHFDYIFQRDVLRANLTSLEDRGLWKLEDKQNKPDIAQGITGHLHVYKVL
ncbi:methyltransferase-like protein 27 [Haliotis rubra]|uniref:methyltransferase-like protein 27 n=1 Tax=Haliotis rubra TaxID=36100 RepID=UPI001EE5D66E|nr:methyltransferase-like protein 27 [Haliotis rubra]